MTDDTGVYAQVKVRAKDARTLHNLVALNLRREYALHNDKFVRPEKYHVTLLYSRVGDVAQIEADPQFRAWAYIKDVVMWTHDDVVLVCTLSCPKLESRHAELMSTYGLQWDHEEYQPHITLAYGRPNIKPDTLKQMRGKLVGRRILLYGESFEALDTDHDDLDDKE
jgi:2'-5' RNA ligase